MEQVNTHPAVVLAMVVVAVALVLITGGKKIASMIAPGWGWFQARHERRFQRQVRIEAAARLLNDERVEILLKRIDGLGAEIVAQRQELTAQRDEERARANRYETELGIVRGQLDEALREIRTLKRDSEVSHD
ncbi:hypothetical protein GS504_24480 [Rhodococcus hoagii]|uniref:hypothetical protein n=1 Tax=Rhodococcus hoagii TaxID=43767 RepID=UPI00197E7B7B|nr:hypothetical protein [Prescottella equi]MBM4708711.1 hypothetical protein [Prescottella equi]MBM4711102.1 hypothetical protein [Prescottella equi]NKR28924.1 hypothetical protein [Prescottella equi]NKR30642.1 hypothetical protein [Prescottella equi]NKS02630.1 hypothetical protein [Prescottella equi]